MRAEIGFIAHSTTQATNALLEGDLARVGVVGLLDGLAWLSKRQMLLRKRAAAGWMPFAPSFAFARARDEESVRASIERLIAGGAQAIAASESFGVDRPAAESFAVAYARERADRRHERPRREQRLRIARTHPNCSSQRRDSAEDGSHGAS